MLGEAYALWDLCSNRQEQGGVTAECRVPDGAVAPHHTLHQETETWRTVDIVQVTHLKAPYSTNSVSVNTELFYVYKSDP